MVCTPKIDLRRWGLDLREGEARCLVSPSTGRWQSSLAALLSGSARLTTKRSGAEVVGCD